MAGEATRAFRGRAAAVSAPDGALTLGQVARSVADLEASLAWYRDCLDLPLLYRFSTLAFLGLGATRLLLTEKQPAAAESILYFAVGDLAARQAVLEARGVVFRGAAHRVYTHTDGSQEWMSFFDDPDGRPLALVERRGPGTPQVPGRR